jgi:hypothetical protein
MSLPALPELHVSDSASPKNGTTVAQHVRVCVSTVPSLRDSACLSHATQHSACGSVLG